MLKVKFRPNASPADRASGGEPGSRGAVGALG